MNLITVEIRSWDKHQKRKDVKHPTWFALSNSLFDDPMFTDLKAEDIIVWVYVLAHASKAKSNIVTINMSHGTKSCRLKKSADFLSSINRLIATTCIKLRDSSIQSDSSEFTDPYTSVQDRHATDTTDITDRQTSQTSQTDNSAELGEPSISAGDTLLARRFEAHQGNPILVNLLRDVSIKVQNAWIDAYEDVGWIVGQVMISNTWMEANPKKRPKKFSQFFTNWLSRGWESYRKGIPSTRQTHGEVVSANLDRIRKKWEGK